MKTGISKTKEISEKLLPLISISHDFSWILLSKQFHLKAFYFW